MMLQLLQNNSARKRAHIQHQKLKLLHKTKTNMPINSKKCNPPSSEFHRIIKHYPMKQ